MSARQSVLIEEIGLIFVYAFIDESLSVAKNDADSDDRLLQVFWLILVSLKMHLQIFVADE